MGLGRKTKRIDNPGQARPIQVTFSNDTEVNDIMKNLNRATTADDSLEQQQIHADKSFKDRDIIRKLIPRAKILSEPREGQPNHQRQIKKGSANASWNLNWRFVSLMPTH